MRTSELEVEPLLLGESKSLFSMLTTPHSNPSSVGVIILNAGLLHNVGPFRLSVDIANTLGIHGFASLRIDQSGKGETPKRHRSSRKESVLLDFDESMLALCDLGIEKVILVGLCSGADDALYISSLRKGIAGLVLLDGYARRTLKYEFRRLGHTLKSVLRRAAERLGTLPRDSAIDNDLREWDSDSEMIKCMANQLDDGIRILAVFTRGQSYYGYLGQLAESLPSAANLGHLEEVFFENSDHTYSSAANRALLVRTISDWTGTNFKRE